MTIPPFLYRSVLTGALSLTALLSWAGDCSAATYVVQNTNSSGSGTLRAALASALTDTDSSDTITFAPGVTGTISTGGMEFLVGKSVTITGPGANLLTVTGGNSSRVFNFVNILATDSLSGLTLTAGSAGLQSGGAVSSLGTLTLTGCAVTGSSASYGGGLFSAGPLTVTGCTFSGDTASFGGGLCSQFTATVTNSTFSGDTATVSGGGLFTLAGLSVVNNTFAGNSAPSGGGLYDSAPTAVTVTASLFAGSTGGDLATAGGQVTSGGSNLLGDAGPSAFSAAGSHDQFGVSLASVNLGPLAANGGPTPTCAVLAGSPAIGGDSVRATTTDQRGTARTSARHTVGAFEFVLAAPVQHTHLLWTTQGSTGGSASLWTLRADGSYPTPPVYGPISGWTARIIADGPDGKTRLLWTRADGRNAVWTIDPTGSIVSTPGYGPYSGWNVASLAVGADNLTRLQWKHSPDGQSSVWTVAGDGSFTSTVGYGPYGSAGNWTASALAVGGDGLSRLLWGNGSGQFSVWTLQAGGITSTPAFNPAGFTATAIAGGPDTNSRLLLNRTDGAAAVWTVDVPGNMTSTPLYGPMAGWAAQGLAVGPDALSRVLWNRTDGASAVWTVNADGSVTSTPLYGPIAGWSAVSLSVGP